MRTGRLFQKLNEGLYSLQAAKVRAGKDALNRRLDADQMGGQFPCLIDAVGRQGWIRGDARW